MSADTLQFTILGCGSSPGVPRIHGDWGACDPREPKNYRLRCSLLVERISESGKTTVVVDTSPDFRQQMLNAGVDHLDGVLYTHPHADHLHGIDDLRGYALVQRELIPVYCDAATSERMISAFGYCFKSPEGSMYHPILEEHRIEAYQPVVINGAGGEIVALPILQTHGPINSLGFRFFTSIDKIGSEAGNASGGLCYSSDVSDIPDESLPYMQKLDWWIVDALQYKEHISHFSLSEALSWIEQIKPANSVLTHMHTPMDYNTLVSDLPKHVRPAYDGMVITVPV